VRRGHGGHDWARQAAGGFAVIGLAGRKADAERGTSGRRGGYRTAAAGTRRQRRKERPKGDGGRFEDFMAWA